MSLFLFLTVVQAIVAAVLVGLVLMQRSEGGGLGIGGGGSPGGLMSARGAADFLTRSTKWTATIFVILAIVLAAVAVGATTGREIDASLGPAAAPAPAIDPLAPVTQPGADLSAPVVEAPTVPETSGAAGEDPLAGVAE